MTDTETTEPATDTSVEDNTEASLRSWGLTGMPVTWAWTDWQPVVIALRAANTGFGELGAVQDMLDMTFPDAGYQAADVALAHSPSGAFSATVTNGTDPADPVGSVRVDLTDDVDLELPGEMVTWDFGDGTTEHGDGADHDYAAAGAYTVRCTVAVAGVLYTTLEEVTIGEPPVVTPTVPSAYAARPETVFESVTDEWPNTSVLATTTTEGATAPATDEPAAEGPYDPGAHTVEEVLAYVVEHPDETEAIAAAEEAGKGRVGILDKI